MVVKIQVVVFFIVLLTILTYFFVRDPSYFSTYLFVRVSKSPTWVNFSNMLTRII